MRYTGEKGKAWEAVKAWVRRGKHDCYTCGHKNLQTFNLQAGHYLPVGHVGSNNKLSWDEHQIRAQCGRCNGPGQGMQTEFRMGLVKEYGEAFVKELDARRFKVDPVKDWKAVKDYFDTLSPVRV